MVLMYGKMSLISCYVVIGFTIINYTIIDYTIIGYTIIDYTIIDYTIIGYKTWKYSQFSTPKVLNKLYDLNTTGHLA